MDSKNAKEIPEPRQCVDDHPPPSIAACAFGVDGACHGKYLSGDKFLAARDRPRSAGDAWRWGDSSDQLCRGVAGGRCRSAHVDGRSEGNALAHELAPRRWCLSTPAEAAGGFAGPAPARVLPGAARFMQHAAARRRQPRGLRRAIADWELAR